MTPSSQFEHALRDHPRGVECAAQDCAKTACAEALTVNHTRILGLGRGLCFDEHLCRSHVLQIARVLRTQGGAEATRQAMVLCATPVEQERINEQHERDQRLARNAGIAVGVIVFIALSAMFIWPQVS